jgi:hypothetical protein
LPSLPAGSGPLLEKGVGGAAVRGDSGSGAGAWLAEAPCVGGSTLKVVPHFGQRIFKPFSGTRRSSTW